MRVWVATYEPDHMNSTVVAVATTPDVAQRAVERWARATASFAWIRHEHDGAEWLDAGSSYEGYMVAPFEVID